MFGYVSVFSNDTRSASFGLLFRSLNYNAANKQRKSVVTLSIIGQRRSASKRNDVTAMHACLMVSGYRFLKPLVYDFGVNLVMKF
ncbi:hypothetical protein T4B_10291 [Trichinella pseudospiralis]|uniref:Uncharacterized protein n=1 Tax=Trichinella pseudospiralis TaxID=6337 RepID=A0A0V1IFI9_TRIPS|nr:hypothetical protein T4B_10291 [Trichinella pseudospiralis]